MPKEIQDEVAKNRQQIGRAFASNRRPATQQDTTLRLSPIPVEVEATVEIYTRPINDTAIGGHPDTSQGWGRGHWGDQRGSWAKQESVTTDLNRNGRQKIAQALVDGSARLDKASVGDAVVEAFGIDGLTDETTGRASFRFSQSPDSVTKGDLRTTDGTIIAEGSVNSVAASVQKEVRVDVVLQFSEASRSNKESVTKLPAVADALRTSQANTATIADIALGTDDTNPTTGDSTLGSKTIQKQAAGNRDGSDALARTLIFKSEPGSQPVTFKELAVVLSDGNLLTRVVFADEDKDDKIQLRCRNGIQITNP